MEHSNSRDLVQLVEKLIHDGQYANIKELFCERSNKHNLFALQEVGVQLMETVCLKHLTEFNYKDNISLYTCVEELLKLIASYGSTEEVLLELLELLEKKSEHIFTSALRALQVVLIRLKDRKPQALDWALNSVLNHLSSLPIPDYLSDGCDLEQQRLLEQDDKVQNLLMHYITVNFFYEPLLQDIVIAKSQKAQTQIHRECGLTRRNIMCCFLVQLLGKPLALLDIARDGEIKETHTRQCAVALTKNITKCIKNPFFFFDIIKRHQMWQNEKDEYDIMTNMFLCKEKLPIDALAIYIYMVFVKEITLEEMPQVYDHIYIFETGLYFVIELLERDEPALQRYGIQLALRLLQNLAVVRLLYISLEMQIHQIFCELLCKIISYSKLIHLRKEGVQLLRHYILQFENEGRYFVIRNLLHSVRHTSISGYLSVLYKDIVAEELDEKVLPRVYAGRYFREIFLYNICNLSADAETDLIESSDVIISGLNTIRFFAIKDYNNRTGFWDIVEVIKKTYLIYLRHGLDMTVAHIKAELELNRNGSKKNNTSIKYENSALTNVHISNNQSNQTLLSNANMDHNKRNLLLNKNLCTLDLIESLLVRTEECLDSFEHVYNFDRHY